MRFHFTTMLTVALALHYCLASRLQAQTAYPMIMSLSPTAAQIGQSNECTIRSRYSMAEAYQILVSGEGVRGEIVVESAPAASDKKDQAEEKKKAASGESLRVLFYVDKDALPGVRDIRVATPRGVSTVGQLVVVADPIFRETEGNDTPDKAQSVTLPATLCGRIDKAEDVDLYRFSIKEPAHFTFHVQCMRLEDRVHDLQTHADPILLLRDASGSVIAASDNNFSADPVISATLERSGEYLIELRDVRYQGNTYWEYSIEINDRPLVNCVYPLGVAAKSAATLDLLGYSVAPGLQASVPASATAVAGLLTVGIEVQSQRLRPLPIVVIDGPIVSETDVANNEPTQAQAVAVGTSINGRIECESDVDCYQFEAKKGASYAFEVFARRAGSALDSHLRLLDEKGTALQLSDDMRLGKRNFADSWIENWTVPKDGKYTLEIRDLHLRGGAEFVYTIQTTESRPSFLLYADTDKTPLTPGTSGVLYVRAERKNGFEGPIELHVDGLPKGVVAHCGRILPGKATDGCIVFEATEQLDPQVAPLTIRGSATFPAGDGKTQEMAAAATIYQEIYQPGGGRGHWPVDRHVLAICAPGDLRAVRVSQTAVSLKPGESTSIDIELERSPGFDKNVTLEVTYSHLNQIFGSSLPEGITVDAATSNTLLTGGATQGKIVLKAAASAPAVDRQQVVVMANVSLNFVMKATYASQPIMVSVSK